MLNMIICHIKISRSITEQNKKIKTETIIIDVVKLLPYSIMQCNLLKVNIILYRFSIMAHDKTKPIDSEWMKIDYEHSVRKGE